MQPSQIPNVKSMPHADRNESTESTIAIKEEREFTRNNIRLQLEMPLSLSADEIIYKLMGRTSAGDARSDAIENRTKMTTTQIIADDVAAHMDHRQFLYWHNQHQKGKPQMRAYAAKAGVCSSKAMVSKIFLNMLRTERLVIHSKDGERVFLVVVEGKDSKTPSRMRRIVRGYRSYNEAENAHFRYRASGHSASEERNSGTDGNECTFAQLLDLHRPEWRLDNRLYDETNIGAERIAQYIAGTSIPQHSEAATIAEALGVSTDVVRSACRKSKAEAGLDAKKPLVVWRESRGMTIKDLAIHSGACVPSIKKYEQGVRPRLLQTCRALAKALRVGVSNVRWESSRDGDLGLKTISQACVTDGEDVGS